VNLIEQEKDKNKSAQQEIEAFRKQLDKMTRLFYAVLGVAAIGVMVCAFLAIGLLKNRP
jgi:hypothetical protein